MKNVVRIIKRGEQGPKEPSLALPMRISQDSNREMRITVKRWIDEFQHRRGSDAEQRLLARKMMSTFCTP